MRKQNRGLDSGISLFFSLSFLSYVVGEGVKREREGIGFYRNNRNDRLLNLILNQKSAYSHNLTLIWIFEYWYKIKVILCYICVFYYIGIRLCILIQNLRLFFVTTYSMLSFSSCIVILKMQNSSPFKSFYYKMFRINM